MKCVNCGATIPERWSYCPICGMEVPTRVHTRREHADIREAEQNHLTRKSKPKVQSDALQKQRRRRKARKKRLAKMRRQRRLVICAMLLPIVLLMAFFIHQISYSGQISKGNKALTLSNYEKAEKYFKSATKKNRKRVEAYEGLAKLYVEKKDLESAENVFLSAIAMQPSNTQLYRSAIKFYLETNQPEKVPEVLNDCEYEEVLKELKDYVTPKPEFDLPEGTYHEVQEVALTSKGNKIYYTIDGSNPDIYSQKYEKPILIHKEGKTQIKAISVNKNKISSVIATKTYNIELPIEEAPAVSPSTGQYEEAAQIEIIVPDGYTAYYTMNGKDPSDPSSGASQYEGPISMPKGQTMFSAVLKKNETDKYTPVTKRNYVYKPEE